ncbi:GGDEF domain-containing protein [Deinococcus humi]|uniref:Diguanylate cyclase n=1 Tax=Deinococcus humi TaxID=662880 RepID=A0A7W8NH65_9DEIO|nr:diguanylate cyclase [Deinococcus humi]MBB5366241.1 diguanylate cyclase [Deinococcus humi]GGO40900.1 GGDEF domain-containing protein [Deinococcus humi]
MNPLGILNELLVNLAMLIAGVTFITLTSQGQDTRESAVRLLLRYSSSVLLGLFLMTHSVGLAPGLLFDFRGVVIALAARRYGLVAGLLVALPLTLYRLSLGGAGAWPGVANLLLVAVLAGAGTGLARRIPRYQEDTVAHRVWTALVLFGIAHLPIFLAFFLAGKPVVQALPIYLTLTVLSALGLVAAHLVKQSRLQSLSQTEQLKQLVFVDPLTGALNRRRFDEDFRRTEQPAFVLLLDLDQFKQINDTFGHERGDSVLRALVRTLQETVRSTDGVYRLGGEEFAVLLSPCDEMAVMRVAQGLRRRVQDLVAARAGLGGEQQVTVSGGLVRLDGEKRDVLRSADKLLYQAKSAGRNCIMTNLPLGPMADGSECRPLCSTGMLPALG